MCLICISPLRLLLVCVCVCRCRCLLVIYGLICCVFSVSRQIHDRWEHNRKTENERAGERKEIGEIDKKREKIKRREMLCILSRKHLCVCKFIPQLLHPEGVSMHVVHVASRLVDFISPRWRSPFNPHRPSLLRRNVHSTSLQPPRCWLRVRLWGLYAFKPSWLLGWAIRQPIV